MSLDTALNVSGGTLVFTQEVGNNADWFEQAIVTHDGAAGEGGDIGDSQRTGIQTTSITGAGTLSFWWKVSSESGYDYLAFYIDVVPGPSNYTFRISGNVDWQFKSILLGSGSHTLIWRYFKDSSDSRGSDIGWVDEVQFSLPIPPDPATTPDPFDTETNVSTLKVLGWTAGSGTTSHKVYLATHTPLLDPGDLVSTQSGITYDPGGMSPTAVHYWRIDEVNAFGTTTGTEWSFTTGLGPPPPDKASDPTPFNGQTYSPAHNWEIITYTFAELSWIAGAGATDYQVYFDVVNPPVNDLGLTGGGTEYYLYRLKYNTTYYWRIDSIGPGGTTTGDVWSFTTNPDPATRNWDVADYPVSVYDDYSSHYGALFDVTEYGAHVYTVGYGYDIGTGNDVWAVRKRLKADGSLVADWSDTVYTPDEYRAFCCCNDGTKIYIGGPQIGPYRARMQAINMSTGLPATWDVINTNARFFTTCSVDGGGVYFVGEKLTNKRWLVTKRDKSTGALIWSFEDTDPVSWHWSTYYHSSLYSGYLYSCGVHSWPTRRGIVEKRDTGTGALSWGPLEVSISGTYAYEILKVCVDSSGVYILAYFTSGSSYRLIKLDNATGAVLWSKNMNDWPLDFYSINYFGMTIVGSKIYFLVMTYSTYTTCIEARSLTDGTLLSRVLRTTEWTFLNTPDKGSFEVGDPLYADVAGNGIVGISGAPGEDEIIWVGRFYNATSNANYIESLMMPNSAQDFIAAPLSGSPPLQVSFFDTSQPPAPGPTFSWDVEFGGDILTRNGIWTYATPGVFDVTFNFSGGPITKLAYITVTGSSGPTMDQIMRNGKWFNGGTYQGFWLGWR